MKKQTKRAVALFTAMLLLFSCFSVAAFAAESDFEWSEKDGKAVITKYVGTSKDVKVPRTLGGLTVTEIGSQAFAFCGIEKIELPNTIEKIGDGAFWQSFFTSFEIPLKVTEIAANTFRECHLLANINLNDGIKSIGEFAFQDCNALTKIVIPDSVEKLGDAAFYSCRGLKTIEIPESITEIPMYTFFCCMELTQVKWHDGITSIGEAAFNQCTSLENIELPAGLTVVGSRAFGICKSLKTVVIPESVETIEQGAFRECDALKKVVVANPDCAIYEDEKTVPESAVLYGVKDSTADKYADKYGLDFIEIEIPMNGDVDGNFSVTAADARLALRISAKLHIPDETQKSVADIDKNGKVTASDARKILRIAANID